MNKVIWRLLKVAGAIVLTYILVIQVLYNISKDNRPKELRDFKPRVFPVKHGQEDQTDFHETIAKPDDQNTNPVSEKPSANKPADKSPKNKPPSGAQRTYVDTLMRKPQQFTDYYHNDSSWIWPDAAHPEDDRIISQMRYGLADLPPDSLPRPMKKILVYTGLRDGMQSGRSSFTRQKCPVDQCELTASRGATSSADVILWQNHLSTPGGVRPPGQIWMIFFLESPYHTPGLSSFNNQVNWTATYRRDSTMVAPYERFTYFNSSVTELPLTKNYAAGKTKKIAWFVSNCGARNNRLGYAQELGKYIEVDIYGACGTKSCPRHSGDQCFNLLSTEYKFYLAFENSNCKDYITEKFFVNGLKNDVLPIVMGAHPDDYKRSAPKNSYIQVDDFDSPEKLAEYLHELDKDDQKYNEYFKWKGTGDNINTYFWCRLCAMAHAADTVTQPTVYKNVESWWRGADVCTELTAGNLWPRWSKG